MSDLERTDEQAETQSQVSAVIRDYLTNQTDVTRPSLNATALSHALIPVLDDLVRRHVEAALTEAALAAKFTGVCACALIPEAVDQ